MIFDLSTVGIKVKIIEQKKLKAIVGLDFGDISIKGFRISESEYENEQGEKLWLTPPSYKDGGGHYHPMFFMPDKELWKRLERKVMETYQTQQREHFKKRLDLSDDDIPIINS